MPTLISGQSGTEDVLQVGLKIDMDTRVFGYDPPGAPYTRLVTKRLKSKKAHATKVSWQEDDIVPFWDTANETIAAGILDFDVTNGTYWQAGDLGKNTATGEIFRVTTVATNNLTIVRGYAGTSAAAITIGDDLLNLRAAAMEGASSGTARATLKVEKYNYTQIVRTPVDITNTNRAVAHYHGDEEAYQRRKAGEDHARTWEEIALHGGRGEDTTTGAHYIRTAGGLDSIITSNVLDVAGGVLTESEFREWLSDCFRYSVSGRQGGKKMLFASRALKLTIDSWGLNKLQLNDAATKTYGMDIYEYIGSTGRVFVVYHPLLEVGYDGTGYLVDIDGCMFRPLRPTTLNIGIQAPDVDGRKSEYITEATFQFALERCFGFIEGVVA